MPGRIERRIFVPDDEYAAVGQVVDHRRRFDLGAMPVVDDGTLVGMISYVDFLRHFSSQQ